MTWQFLPYNLYKMRCCTAVLMNRLEYLTHLARHKDIALVKRIAAIMALTGVSGFI